MIFMEVSEAYSMHTRSSVGRARRLEAGFEFSRLHQGKDHEDDSFEVMHGAAAKAELVHIRARQMPGSLAEN
jgi:hypothetical protein